jgi:hypothetical protein
MKVDPQSAMSVPPLLPGPLLVCVKREAPSPPPPARPARRVIVPRHCVDASASATATCDAGEGRDGGAEADTEPGLFVRVRLEPARPGADESPYNALPLFAATEEDGAASDCLRTDVPYCLVPVFARHFLTDEAARRLVQRPSKRHDDDDASDEDTEIYTLTKEFIDRHTPRGESHVVCALIGWAQPRCAAQTVASLPVLDAELCGACDETDVRPERRADWHRVRARRRLLN